MNDKSNLEQINDMYKVAEYMEDRELTEALEFIAKLIFKPDIPMKIASTELVRMQAIAAKLSLQASWLTNVDKSDRAKKNLYYTAAEELDKVVASLKYLVRT